MDVHPLLLSQMDDSLHSFRLGTRGHVCVPATTSHNFSAHLAASTSWTWHMTLRLLVNDHLYLQTLLET